MPIFKSKRHKETSTMGDSTKPEPSDTEPARNFMHPLFGDGLIPNPPASEPPKFGDEFYATAVASMIEANAPRRFAVIGHDKDNDNSTVLAWGLDYGDDDIHIDSTRDSTRWHVNKPEEVFKYFPEPPEPDCLQILWIDGSNGLVHWPRNANGTGAIKQSVTAYVGQAVTGEHLIRAAVAAVRAAHSQSNVVGYGSTNPNPYAATESYWAAEHSLAEAGAHLAKANYHARHYRDSI